jgi:2-C-methyl-D-erythritol 4-phosphate cytidylyltransferase
MDIAGIVVAAGRGERLGAALPKALVLLADVPLVVHAVLRLHEAGVLDVVVVHPPGDRSAFVAVLDAGVRGPLRSRLTLVAGGAERTDSVRAGLEVVPADVRVVAVHDAARPLMPAHVIATALAAVTDTTDVLAAAPAVELVDTVKRVMEGDGTEREVLATLPRDSLAAVQTPQVFRRDALEAALAAAHATGSTATDDLALVEQLRDTGALSGRIVLVPGAAAGRKVTRPLDLVILAHELAAAPDPELV